jgi:hypothetical protein
MAGAAGPNWQDVPDMLLTTIAINSEVFLDPFPHFAGVLRVSQQYLVLFMAGAAGPSLQYEALQQHPSWDSFTQTVTTWCPYQSAGENPNFCVVFVGK